MSTPVKNTAKSTDKNSEPTLSILSVGTQILTKDLMDQYIRSLGPFRTHYAASAKVAYRINAEAPSDILITEMELQDASPYDLIQTLKKNKKGYLYTILAASKDDEATRGLAEELEVDFILLKPFTAKEIKSQIEAYQTKMTNKHDPDLLLYQADLAFDHKEFNKAEQLFEIAVKACPKVSRVYHRTGKYFLTKPDYDKAEGLFSEAIQLDPQNAAALTQLALLLQRKKDFEEAYSLFMRASRISPLNPERILLIHRLLQDWSVRTLKDAIIQHPSRDDFKFELGRTHVAQGNYAAAYTVLGPVKSDASSPLQREAMDVSKLAAKLGGIKE